MGYFSKDPNEVLTDALEKGYSRVLFQQGKPVLDRELTLLGSLTSAQRLASQHLGNGVPADGNGFLISELNVTENDFTINAGRCLVNGYEVVLNENKTYKTQPHTENVAEIPEGTSYVYLRVFTHEISAIEDNDLSNTDDVGFETSIRERIEWEVFISTDEIIEPDHFLLALIDKNAATVDDRRRKGLFLADLVDEMTYARGSADTLKDRLDISFEENGTLKSNSVGTDQIQNQAVIADKLAESSVTTEKINNGAVTGEKISSSAVTRSKIANQAISDAKLADEAVTENKLGEGAVTESKITNQAVTQDKVDNEAITSEKISAESVTEVKIAAQSVTQEKVADNTVAIQQLKHRQIPKKVVMLDAKSEIAIPLVNGKRHAYLLISLSAIEISGNPRRPVRISWNEYFTAGNSRSRGLNAERGIMVRNYNSSPVKVEVKAFEIHQT